MTKTPMNEDDTEDTNTGKTMLKSMIFTYMYEYWELMSSPQGFFPICSAPTNTWPSNDRLLSGACGGKSSEHKYITSVQKTTHWCEDSL